ncbi:MAG: hypothetical protein KC441_12210, partial [Anaerolineales bacterium]|nr:hypothetical protein [Anaerolineales bacterium]
MAKGKVEKIHGNGSSGHIKPDDGGAHVYFQTRWVKNLPPEGVTIGMPVEFESKSSPKGPQTAWVRYAGAQQPQPQRKQPSRPAQQPGNNYRFLNPYNFVRYLPKREVTTDDPAVQLIGRTSPPTHDRWVGLSGQITCQLETVTPLFISDTEGVQIEREIGAKKKHFSYRFFRLGEQKAIPASSLRGMVRAVFEAATNSAFSNLGGERLSYRLPSNEIQKLVPARVIKQQVDDKVTWHLQLLPGAAPFAPQVGQKKGLYAAPTRFYRAVKPTGRRRQNPPPPLDGAEQWQHGQAYFAVLRQVKFPPSWRVLDLLPTDEAAQERLKELRSQWRDKLVVRHGWLCKTNQ